ncbi:uncharacterized protein PHACADRAFT_202671 [Phanerochaete carnosa HHB-10118-sp]|uniref:Uncharacterized protein n=1 Tax=Phanerochaete carnosa (strain HHB-10118-sp) TaxID=650164 RepID=K5VPP6_PHACS|nr:uncharacterized protein PHACADRAFT_202671 [Phanerochaete carnosa HHB-10118-sp]EKM48554.1 hypothetical protein PHACADRAFT_202671 [Phanerochaete carnosa HHB-10118-sp]
MSTCSWLSSKNLSILARLNIFTNASVATPSHGLEVVATSTTLQQQPSADPLPTSEPSGTSVPPPLNDDSDLLVAAEQKATLVHVHSLNRITDNLMQQSEQNAQALTQMGTTQLMGPVHYGCLYQILLARMFNYKQAYWMDIVKK